MMEDVPNGVVYAMLLVLLVGVLLAYFGDKE